MTRASLGREQSAGSIAPADVGRRYAIESDGLQGEADQVIVGLPPISAADPASRLAQSEGLRYLVHVILLTLAVGCAVEIAGTLAIPRWPASALEITGPEEALLLAKAGAQRGPYVLLLGDSVMRDGALRRLMGREAAKNTIPRFIAARAQRELPASAVVNLSMEGALINDYAGLLQLVRDRGLPPSAVVMQLDYRVLSPVHDDEQNLSRPWLEAYVRGAEHRGVADGASPELMARPIDDRMHQLLLSSDAFLLMRGGRHAVGQWLADGTQAVFNRLGAARVASASTQDADVLRLTVGQFYRTEREAGRSQMLVSLVRVLDTLAQQRIPVLLAFTPTNVDFLGDQIDIPVYRANVSAVQTAVEQRYGSGLRWMEWDGELPPRMFIDHVHLLPEGNRLVADRLFDSLLLLLHDTAQ